MAHARLYARRSSRTARALRGRGPRRLTTAPSGFTRKRAQIRGNHAGSVATTSAIHISGSARGCGSRAAAPDRALNLDSDIRGRQEA
jgi:hypothetical protein